MNFSKFKNRYIITGELIVENALHIGSGEVEGDKDAPFVKRGVSGDNNDFYIPGSSFRGYLRSKLEGLVDLGLEVGNEKLTDLHIMALFGYTNLEKECKRKNIKNGYEDMKDILKIKDAKKWDSAMGRIHIADMPIIIIENDKEKQAKEITRDGIKIDRNTGTTEDGAKFDYNVVNEGAKFKFTMTLENVEKYELDLLRIALQFILRKKNEDGSCYGGDIFGGKTSRGIGKCQLELIDAKYVEANAIKDFVLNGKMQESKNPMGILTTNVIK